MDRPAKHAEADEPNNGGSHKEKKRGKHAALDQLTQAGKKETANSRNDISRRSLIFVHGKNIPPLCGFRKRFHNGGASGFSMTQHPVFGTA